MQLRARLAWGIVAVSLIGVTPSIQSSKANEFEYPELMVAPRASERLKMEAQAENEGKWLRFWPIQLSAISTLSMGLSAAANAQFPGEVEPRVSDRRITGYMGATVGAAWLVTSIIMSAVNTPYQTGWDTVKAMPASTKREQLTRERVAEEILADASAMGWRLTILSTVTQFGVSLYTTRLAGLDATITPILALTSATLSVLPVLFRFKWIGVYAQHQDYKKKIYGPIAQLQPGLVELTRGELSPGLAFSLTF